MQFRDLRRQYEALKPAIDSALHETVLSSAFIMGQPVKRLEEALAEYVGVKHCITCASGTDALDIALKVRHPLDRSPMTRHLEHPPSALGKELCGGLTYARRTACDKQYL